MGVVGNMQFLRHLRTLSYDLNAQALARASAAEFGPDCVVQRMNMKLTPGKYVLFPKRLRRSNLTSHLVGQISEPKFNKWVRLVLVEPVTQLTAASNTCQQRTEIQKPRNVRKRVLENPFGNEVRKTEKYFWMGVVSIANYGLIEQGAKLILTAVSCHNCINFSKSHAGILATSTQPIFCRFCLTLRFLFSVLR